jgi:hypothetical protein
MTRVTDGVEATDPVGSGLADTNTQRLLDTGKKKHKELGSERLHLIKDYTQTLIVIAGFVSLLFIIRDFR